ncbi:MAG: hypothetical protein ACYDFR_03215 [Candidatus Omnitrophota bacterium]
MSGKQTVKAELEEELMEAAALMANFGEETIGKILEDLSQNESLDYQDDKSRSECFGFLLKALEAYNAKDYEGMQKYTHAAIQKLHQNETLDFKDDHPRCDARIKLSESRIKALHISEKITKLTARFRGIKQ